MSLSRTKPSETKLVIALRHAVSHWNPPPQFAEGFRSRWPEMKILHLSEVDLLDREIVDTDILVGFSIRPEQLAAAPKLKWIHSFSAGVAQLMFPEMQSSALEITNASSVHCVPIAQHILGVLIAQARRFPDCLRYQQRAQWASQELWNAPVRPRELRGQVLLFVGFGAIGRETAKLVRPMEMRVWAVTRSGRADSELAERSFAAADLHKALSGADYVVVAAPDTPETRGMIGAAEFERMKPSAYFVNVARGVIVDEAALIGALERRAIAGAALDVTSHEPLPGDSPLWKLDNAFITPHMSGLSDHTWERQQELLMDNLERWFSGRELVNRVNLEQGY
jgi:D-2-hydroxyacid dehydrogenase (NADP+)